MSTAERRQSQFAERQRRKAEEAKRRQQAAAESPLSSLPAFEEWWQKALTASILKAYKASVPLYLGHSRSTGKTSAMYAAMGSEPYGTVEAVFGPGSAYGAPHRRTSVMSLGIGRVVVLDGPDAGTIR